MKRSGNNYRRMAAIGICMGMFMLTGCGNTDSSDNAVQQTDTIADSQVQTEANEDGSESGKNEFTAENITDSTAEDTQETGQGEMTAGTYPDGSSPEFGDTRIRLTIDGQEVIIRMYDNTAATDFVQNLPLENLNFFDLSGIEKPVERPETPYSMGEETPGYDPVTGDMVIYRPWGNFTIFYGDFRHSDELVPLGQVESGLDIVAGQTEDFTGTIELVD